MLYYALTIMASALPVPLQLPSLLPNGVRNYVSSDVNEWNGLKSDRPATAAAAHAKSLIHETPRAGVYHSSYDGGLIRRERRDGMESDWTERTWADRQALGIRHQRCRVELGVRSRAGGDRGGRRDGRVTAEWGAERSLDDAPGATVDFVVRSQRS